MMDAKKKALHYFQKGLDMDMESDPNTYHQIERQRMLMLSQIGESQKSILEQTTKLQESPNDFFNHINLLVAYIYANDYQNALKTFLEAEKAHGSQSLLYALGGDIYRELREYDQAFECWNKAIALDPEMVDSLWSKAFCYEELGDYRSAYLAWEEVIHWLETRGYDVEVETPRKFASKCKEKIDK